MAPGPACSSVATCETTVSPSPERVASTRRARSASCTGSDIDVSQCRHHKAGSFKWVSDPIRRRTLFVGERLDHLFGDVDALARVHDGILQDQVELLGLGNLQDDLVRALLESRELLVSPQVDVLAKLALPALEIAREVGEITLLVAAIIFRHRRAVLVETCLQIAHLLRQLLDFGIARCELALELLLRALRGRRFAEQALGVDEADLVVERGHDRRESDERRADYPGSDTIQEILRHTLEGRCGRELKPLYPVAFLCIERYPVTELERTDGRAPGDTQTG